MRRLGSRGLLVFTVFIALAMALPAGAAAGVKFTRVASIPGQGGQVYSFVRTANGALHLVYPTTISPQQGLSSLAISPSGAIGSATTALSTQWGASFPGLVVLANGSLEAFYGAVSPFNANATLWGITSSDGGTTWSSPVEVRSGPALEAQAYNAAITARLSGTTPVLTLDEPGGLVVQQGLGPAAPVSEPTTASDDFVTDVDFGARRRQQRGGRELGVAGQPGGDADPGSRSGGSESASPARPVTARSRDLRSRQGAGRVRRLHDRRQARAAAALRRRQRGGRRARVRDPGGARHRDRARRPDLGHVGQRQRQPGGHAFEQGRDPLRARPTSAAPRSRRSGACRATGGSARLTCSSTRSPTRRHRCRRASTTRACCRCCRHR